MPSAVLWLDQVRAADTPSVGAKAARLGELVGRGFPVPPGFVVTADAYREAFRGLEPDGGVRRRLESTLLPEALSAAIHDAYNRLIRERGPALECAVRSSAIAEDLAGASFAGQHGTYYHVDEVDLLQRVRQCWASLWTREAVAYRAARGIEPASAAMAVIVQELVPSEVAGVAFTAHPVTGARDELVIECCWGMGAALVDGRVSPDRYVLARDGLGVRERRIGDKRVMVVSRRLAEGASRLQEVPQALRRGETLSTALAREVAEAALACEAAFGGPQDVEWALAGGRLHLLQSRPVTTLGAKTAAGVEGGPYVLFKPTIENFTEPMTPLTADFFGMALPPGLKFIDGWGYFDLGRVRPLVPLRLTDRQLANVLYLGAEGVLAARARVSLSKLPLVLLVFLLVQITLGVPLARTRRLPDGVLDEFRTLCRRVAADPRHGPIEAFRRLFVLPRMLDPIGRMPVLVNVLCIRFVAWIALLRRLLARWVPELGEDAWTPLCAGEPGILSAEMGRDIASLAAEACAHPAVAERLRAEAGPRVLEELRAEPEARAFLERLDAFLARNGHRAMRELEIASPRWDEDPSPVLGMVRNHLLSGATDADRDSVRTRHEVEAEIRRALASLPFERALGLRFRLIRLAAARVRYFLKLRENSRFYWIMAFQVVRRKVLEVERRLLGEGRLKCRGDVFFLRWAEIVDLANGRLGWTDVEDRLRERRLTHLRRSRTPPPRTIGLAPDPQGADVAGDGSAVTEAPALLRGHGASPGRYEGRARVVLDASLDAELRPGEVLVAPFTDPAWTPLFLTAGAAVVEVGSFLSHAGTVAREYGLPCVVDVEGCTRRIETGARLCVDGDRGTVQVLEEARS